MTRQRTLKTRVLSAFVLFIAVLTAARAQQILASTESLVASVPVQAMGTQSWRRFAPTKKDDHGVRIHRLKTRNTVSNPGSVTFDPPVTYATGGDGPWGAAIADVNADGKPDLIVTNGDSVGFVGVLLGNGDGTFQPVVDYDSGGTYAYGIASSDVNGDGKLDLVVAHATFVSILLGNGDGTFQAARNYDSGPGGAYESYVAIADLNGDQKPDLVVTHYCGSGSTCVNHSVNVLLGNGDGTFRAAATYASGGFGSNYVAVADVNGDGLPDLLVSHWCATSCSTPSPTEGAVGVLLGKGDGTFQAPVTYLSGGNGTASLAIADVNGDGKLDLITASCGPSACGPGRGGKGNVGVLLGNSDGTFQSAVTYAAGNSPIAVVMADVNGDSKVDIVVGNWGTSNGGSNDGEVTTLLANGDGTFQAAVSFPSGANEVPSIAVGDLNGDGRPDVVAASAGLFGGVGVVSVLINSTGSGQVPTTTSLTSSPDPSTFGQGVIFTALVTSSSGTPTGAVQVLNGSTVVRSGTLAGGSVSIPVSTLPAGSDSITASYLGGSGFAPSKSAALTQTVTVATTTTSLTSSLNPAGTNQAITFTAKVTSQYGGAASGTAAFMAGSQNLGSASLAGNVATLTTSFATAGNYSITVRYAGDSNNTGSLSATLNEKVITSTTTALVSSLNPSLVGQAVTFTATVSSSAGAPPNGETITFKNGAAVLGTAPLSGGMASMTTSSLPAGAFTITASYPGDSTFAASTSPGLRQVVNSTTKSPTTTTFVSSLNPSIYGQKVTWTATVTTTGSVPPTGTVVFAWSDGFRTFNIGSAILNSSGVAILTRSSLNADPYPLTAKYQGDANNLTSTSPILNQTVLQTTSAATITSWPNPSILGQAVTFTAKITSPTVTPTGPVTFTTGKTVLGTAQLSGGKATLTISSLPAGSIVVTVTFAGDSNITKSSAAVTQVVQQ